ncbi:hypothetical protein F4810DRAFT_709637 [Camillea tinctor]|nr:hypothetical protein F4810DRAFT_709637 [Camillea tinctor]
MSTTTTQTATVTEEAHSFPMTHCLRPWSPLPVFCLTFLLQALGMAYQDSHANTFVSGLRNVPHRWLGFIHACYALGCFVGPLFATGPNAMAIDG